ncbi:MAG: hypothetical protein NVS1B4_08930 [Gemmatimonadaceae bacterium]
MKTLLLSVSAAASLCVGLTVRAQEPRPPARVVEVARLVADTDANHVKIDFAGGHLRVGSAAEPYLYTLRVREPQHAGSRLGAYDPASHTLTVGASHEHRRWLRLTDATQGAVDLNIAGSLPTDVTAHLLATKSAFDFRESAVSLLTIDAALSKVSVVIGDGNGPGETDVHVHGVLSAVTISVPPDVGVQLNVRSKGGGTYIAFPHAAGRYMSPDWATARRRVSVTVRTLFTRVRIERLAR